MMDLHTRYFQDAGYEVISVAPFNEPDYSYTGQGTREDFYKIAVGLRANPRFENIRICGGNTLNCDEALLGITISKNNLMREIPISLPVNSMVTLISTRRFARMEKMAMNDEMHNVMEAMVGLEYGLQTGIWWGSAEYARGEFCKISRGGERLAYTEHRPNWTAASVYRSKDGSKVQALEAFRNVRLKRQLIVLYPKRRMCSMMVMVRSVSSTWRCPEENLIRTMNSGMPNGWSILLGEKIFSR